MFNLLRSDLWRIVRMPSFWFLTLLVVASLASLAWFMDYLASPEFAQSVNASIQDKIQEDNQASLEEYTDEGLALNAKSMQSVPYTWANTFLDGGMLGIIGSLLAAIFLISDFKSGFIKVLPMDRRGRWRYFGEKTILVLILQAYVLVLCAATSFLAFQAFGFTYEETSSIGDVALWLLCAWLYASAMALVVSFITWIWKSEAVSSLVALFISGGILGAVLLQLIYYFTNAVRFLSLVPQWLLISAQADLRTGDAALFAPSTYEAFTVVPVWAHEVIICALFIALSCAVIFGLCRKRDLA